jgi:hypothetical protein
MKERLLTNWTLARVLYLVMGIMIIVQTIMSRQWIGVAFGGYFASMGLFAFGCASGNCFGGKCATDSTAKSESSIQNIGFEELKSK